MRSVPLGGPLTISVIIECLPSVVGGMLCKSDKPFIIIIITECIDAGSPL